MRLDQNYEQPLRHRVFKPLTVLVRIPLSLIAQCCNALTKYPGTDLHSRDRTFVSEK